MPAPSKPQIKEALRAAFIAAGPEKFAKRDDDGNVVPGELQPALEDMLDAIAVGMNNFWVTWQASQLVITPGVTPGSGTGTGTMP